jgi:hypothetical protein
MFIVTESFQAGHLGHHFLKPDDFAIIYVNKIKSAGAAECLSKGLHK